METSKEITYFIAFGGNIGNVLSTFRNVFTELNSEIGTIEKISKIYRSKPLPTTVHGEQDPYLNGVLILRSALDPRVLLNKLIEIEQSLGRDRTLSAFWGPRKIDLDIISADDLIIDESDLKIPHPRRCDRDFVLVPIRDVSPLWVDPMTGKSIESLITELTEDKIFISEMQEDDLSSFIGND